MCESRCAPATDGHEGLASQGQLNGSKEQQLTHRYTYAFLQNHSVTTSLVAADTVPSIYLDRSIYLPHKYPARKEANCACHTEEAVGDDCHVAKVHCHWHISGDVQLSPEIEDGVQEEVACRGPRCEICPPPASPTRSGQPLQ